MHRTGWFRVQRESFDHQLAAESKPYSPLLAWYYLIAWAAWEDERRDFQGQFFELHRGQHVTTYRQLARDFGWSPHRAIRFLKRLENDKMVGTETAQATAQAKPANGTANGTGNGTACILVTICNYDRYQSSTDDTAQATARPAAQGRRKNGTANGTETAHEVRREEQQQEKEKKNPEKKPYPRAQAKRAMHDFNDESDPLNKIQPLESLLLFSERTKTGVPEDIKAELARNCSFAIVWQLAYHAERQVNPGGYIRDAIRKRYELVETLTKAEAAELRTKFFSNGHARTAEPTTINNAVTKSGNPC